VNFRSDAHRRAVFASLANVGCNKFSASPLMPGENIASAVVGIWPDMENGHPTNVSVGKGVGSVVYGVWPDETAHVGTRNKFDDAIVGLWPPDFPVDERESDAVINNMIADQIEFVSSEDIPAPSFLTGDQLSDVAAVVAGSKPAAVISYSEGDPRQEKMLERARGRGLVVEFIDDNLPDLKSKSIVVGKPANVDAIKRLRNSVSGNPPDAYHIVFGRALGYHPAAIKKFVLNSKVNAVSNSDGLVVLDESAEEVK